MSQSLQSRANKAGVKLVNAPIPPYRPAKKKKAKTLPPELIKAILSRARGVNGEINKRDFRRFSRVCRDWTPHAQEILFRDVSLHWLSQRKSFTSAVSKKTERGRRLGSYIRCLELRGMGDREFRYLAEAVLLCPQLYELNLDLGLAIDVRIAGDVALMMKDAPKIEALRIRNVENLDIAWVAVKLLPPTIRFLYLDNWQGVPIFGSAPRIPPSLPLYEFTLHHGSIPFDSLLPLLGQAHTTLQILELCITPPRFAEMMETHGPYLRSLRLSKLTDEQAAALVDCTNLEEFQYGMEPSPALLASLPATLEHLKFASTKKQNYDLIPLCEFILQHPSLAVLSYVHDFTMEDEICEMLERYCFMKRVIFFGIDSCGFSNEPTEPLVEPDWFPRFPEFHAPKRHSHSTSMHSLTPPPTGTANGKTATASVGRSTNGSKPRVLTTLKSIFS